MLYQKKGFLMNHTKRLLKSFIYIVIFVFFGLSGCSNKTNISGEISPTYKGNVLVAFFEEAELQIETGHQCRELARALQDMLTLTPDALRMQRYANYQLEPKKWTLNEILSHYYYARPPIEFEELLYRDVTTTEGRVKIEQALKEVNRGE